MDTERVGGMVSTQRRDDAKQGAREVVLCRGGYAIAAGLQTEE
jgi:hypothetical protein